MLKFASLDDEERMDPMVRVFPKVTKCSFQNFGVSGSIQEWVKINHQRSDIFKLVSKLSRFDGLCVLPINMINDKIYILLWFWLFILAIISGLHFIYRLNIFLLWIFETHFFKTWMFVEHSTEDQLPENSLPFSFLKNFSIPTKQCRLRRLAASCHDGYPPRH